MQHSLNETMVPEQSHPKEDEARIQNGRFCSEEGLESLLRTAG
jgi:hypothetical protein